MERSLVFIVLNKIELFEKLCVAMNDAGFGGTAISTSGMAQELAKNEDSHIISSFRAFMASGRTENKTIFTVIPNNRIDSLKTVVEKVIGDISKPDTGVIFALPVTYFDGFIK